MRVCRCQTKKGKFTKCGRKGLKKVCYTTRRRRGRR